MSGFYEKNMEALGKFQRRFAAPQTREEGVFELCRDKNGLPNAKRQHNGKDVYIHGEEDVLETARTRTEQINLSGNGLIVSFGLGFGYEAREIIKKMDKGTSFIVAEPSAEVLALALEETDLTDIISAPNVHFMMFTDRGTALPYFREFIGVSNYKNLAAYVLQPYVELFFEKCRELLYAVDDTRMASEMSEATVLSLSAVWQKNALLNTKHNINSYLVSDFFGKLNVPAVIVSAGPSLTKNVALLRGMEDKCLILCVDTALKPLLEMGIKPHFMFSMDGKESVYRAKFGGLNYSGIPLVYVPTSAHAVVENHRGTKVLSIIQDSFYRSVMADLGRNVEHIELGGSVATAAFSFAQRAGASVIVLIGQDLAYTDMKTHAEGATLRKDVDLSACLDVVSVPSVDGGQVYTDKIFQTYITWFQTYAASDVSGRKYIDATEGGAVLLGFENARLKDVLEKYMTKPGVNALVEEAFAQAHLLAAGEKKIVREKYKAARGFIESIKVPARAASKQLERIAALLAKPSPNYAVITSAYSRTSSFESKLQAGRGNLELLSIALAPFAEKLNAEFENAEFKSDLEKNRFAANAYTRYYREIADVCEKFSGLLRDVF